MSERIRNRRAATHYIQEQLKKLTLVEQREVLTFELARIRFEAFEEREVEYEARGPRARDPASLDPCGEYAHEWITKDGRRFCATCGVMAAWQPSGDEWAGSLRVSCTSSSGHEWQREPGFLLKCKNCGAAGIPIPPPGTGSVQ